MYISTGLRLNGTGNAVLGSEDSALITLNITEDIQLPKGSMAQLTHLIFLVHQPFGSLKLILPSHWSGFVFEGIQKEGLLNTFTDRGTAINSVAVTITLLNENYAL